MSQVDSNSADADSVIGEMNNEYVTFRVSRIC